MGIKAIGAILLQKDGSVAILSGRLGHRYVHARIHGKDKTKNTAVTIVIIIADEWKAKGCLCYLALQLLGSQQQAREKKIEDPLLVCGT